MRHGAEQRERLERVEREIGAVETAAARSEVEPDLLLSDLAEQEPSEVLAEVPQSEPQRLEAPADLDPVLDDYRTTVQPAPSTDRASDLMYFAVVGALVLGYAILRPR